MVLFGLIIIAIVTPYIYQLFFLKTEGYTAFEKNAIQELNLVAIKEKDKNSSYRNEPEAATKSYLFKFDPNLIYAEDWIKLGLSPKQAQSILNYRNKGGKFYKVEDLKKMYAISPKMFERLAPYVEVADNTAPGFEKKNKLQKILAKKELTIIEVNGADTLKLDEIKGVGAAFARRIVKYRDRLGGFYKKEQLMEVYGVDSMKFEEIKAQIVIDASAIKKININTADFETLKTHPYLKYKQINAIINYRKQHGNYSGIADLKKVLILSPQTIEQLTPYLQF